MSASYKDFTRKEPDPDELLTDDEVVAILTRPEPVSAWNFFTGFTKMPEPPQDIRIEDKKAEPPTPTAWQKISGTVTAPVTYFFPGKKTEEVVEIKKEKEEVIIDVKNTHPLSS